MKRVALILMSVVLILSCVLMSLINEIYSNEPEINETIFYDNGHLIETTSTMNPVMLDYALNVFNRVYDEQLKNNDVYFAVIPDKYMVYCDNSAEYNEYCEYLENGMSFAQRIDLYDLLPLSDYYFSDPHWKQQALLDVTQRLTSSMSVEYDSDFASKTATSDFSGSYSQRSNIEHERDELVYLSNEMIDQLSTDEGIAVYDFKKLESDEPYDFFLSGNQSVVTLKNESSDNDKRLVVFRDSFASAIAPVLSCSYSEVVLVDLRYIMSDMLSDYVNFEGADVLFLYSTLLLNNSMSMK